MSMSSTNLQQQARAVLPGAERPHLKALTSIRIFAAAHVLGLHFAKPLVERNAARLHAGGDGSVLRELAARVLDGMSNFLAVGAASVSLFFVLSGFILAYNYLDPSVARQTTRRQFWAARFARVYPAFLLAWLIAAPSAMNQLRHGDVPASQIKRVLLPLLSLVAAHAWVPAWALAWNAPSWSLCTEALFYLLFPILFVINRPAIGLEAAIPSESKIRARHFRWLAVFLGLALAVPVIDVILDPDHLGILGMRQAVSLDQPGVSWLRFVSVFPPLRQFELLAGVALGSLFLSDLRVHRRPPAWLGWTAAGAIIIVSLLRPWVPFVFYTTGGLALLYAILIYSLAHGRSPARMIGAAWLVVLGEASYALYILHVPLAGFYRVAAKKLFPGQFVGLSGELARTPSWGYFVVYARSSSVSR